MSLKYHANMEFFSLRLAKLRMKKGLSAKKMSESLGRSKGYIGGMERKHNFPSMNEFFYICDFLEITPKEFFDEEIEAPAIYLELIKNQKVLDEEQLQNINGIVKSILKNK